MELIQNACLSYRYEPSTTALLLPGLIVITLVLMKLRENITEQDYAPMKTDLDKLIGIIPGV